VLHRLRLEGELGRRGQLAHGPHAILLRKLPVPARGRQLSSTCIAARTFKRGVGAPPSCSEVACGGTGRGRRALTGCRPRKRPIRCEAIRCEAMSMHMLADGCDGRPDHDRRGKDHRSP
jgi:hypothetical protein